MDSMTQMINRRLRRTSSTLSGLGTGAGNSANSINTANRVINRLSRSSGSTIANEPNTNSIWVDAERTLVDNERQLWMAAEYGFPHLVNRLLGENVNVNAVRADGMPPLLLAAQNGHLEIVARLIEAHANINLGTPDGLTPITAAAQAGHNAVVNVLMRAHAAENLQRYMVLKASLAVAESSNMQVMRALDLINKRDHERAQILHIYDQRLKSSPNAITPALQRYLDSFANKPKNEEQCRLYSIENKAFECPISMSTMNVPVRLDGAKYDYDVLLNIIVTPQGKRINPVTKDPFLMLEVQADRETQHAIEAAIREAQNRAAAQDVEVSEDDEVEILDDELLSDEVQNDTAQNTEIQNTEIQNNAAQNREDRSIENRSRWR